MSTQTLSPKAHLISIDHDLRGPYELINEMMKAVTTEWFCILPDDDLMHSDHLSVLSEMQNVDLAYSEGRFFGEGAEERNKKLYWGPFIPDQFIKKIDTGLRGAHFLMRTEMFTSLGGFDCDADGPDHEFLCRFLTRNPMIRRCDKHTWDYRLHDDSLSAIDARLSDA